MGLETGHLHVIAFAAEETAVPTLPNKGSNVNWSAASSWTTIGGRDQGHDADLAADSVSVTALRDRVKLKAPRAQANQKSIQYANAVDTVSFNCHEVSQTVLDLDSSRDSTGNITERTDTVTRRAMIIELYGHGLLYYPSVEVDMDTPMNASGQASGMTAVTVHVFGTDTIPSGEQFHQYPEA